MTRTESQLLEVIEGQNKMIEILNERVNNIKGICTNLFNLYNMLESEVDGLKKEISELKKES